MNYSGLPVVIDLFSGCGGLAFGFKTAGYQIAHGIDLNEAAARTASYNLYWRYGEHGQHTCGDVAVLEPGHFKNKIGDNGCIIIGGPPCQAYSQIGKAKLRSLGENRCHLNDSRGYLFQEFVRFALELDARVVVMENVPEAVNYGGLNVPQHICEIMEGNNYSAFWTIFNAADFGVPQIRERVFVFAVKKSEINNISLPTPTHKSINGKSTPGQMRFDRLLGNANFKLPKCSGSFDLPDWITVEEAISDLPSLYPTSECKYQLYQPHILMSYKTEPQNSYQHLMRTWFDTEQQASSGHCFRRTRRDFPIFEKMKANDDYLAACKIAEELLEEVCRSHKVSMFNNEEEYKKLRKSIVPPYSKDKFHEKWKKLSPDKPSHTLVAHLSTDSYSHIHPWEPRGISLREAARLQSFPDDYLFQCSMSDSFNQIGNAVPPLMSKAIAQSLAKEF